MQKNYTNANGRPTRSKINGEIIDIVLYRTETEGLGFNIRGGYDMPHIPEDSGVFVTKIREDGAAASDGRLSEGDKILKINGQSMENISHRMAVTMFKTAGDVVNLTVLKDAERKIVEATYQTVNPKTQSNSVEMLLLGLGATVLVGFVLYKCRNSVKTVISRVFPSHSDKYAGFTYRPYR